jgi:hypothetical protein
LTKKTDIANSSGHEQNGLSATSVFLRPSSRNSSRKDFGAPRSIAECER